jgi:putative transposase
LIGDGFSVRVICELLQLPRSSFYYHSHPKSRADEGEVVDHLQKLAGRWVRYGYRRLTKQLHREGRKVNSKRVRRLMQELKLSRSPYKRKVRTTNSQHPYKRYANLVQDLVVTRPDQVWVGDLTYVRLDHDFVYLAVLMDVYTRAIRGWHLGRSLEGELTLTALKRALVNHKAEIHHSDQGVQYAANSYVKLLRENNIGISMAEVGEPTQNGYAERLMRTIKEEEVTLSDYQDFADAYRRLGEFLDEVYTHKRIHSSLGYLTPAEFESQWQAQKPAPKVTQADFDC